MLTDNDFNLALYAPKLIDEVLSTRIVTNFSTWCDYTGREVPQEVTNPLHQFESVIAKDDLIPTIFSQLEPLIQDKVTPLLE